MPHQNDSAAERFMQGELALWRVRTRHGEGLIAEQGAQLLEYTPTGQKPLVWLSPQAKYERGESVRGGVPVCWPWFGDLSRNPEDVRVNVGAAQREAAPKHGFVRTRDWVHADTTTDSEGVTLVFRLDVSGDTPGWSHPAHLTLRARFAETLTLELGVSNQGDERLVISQALHTYFAVSDVRDVTVTGVEGATFIDTLDDWQTKTQAGPLAVTGETDRLYVGVDSTFQIHDPKWARRIEVQSTHSRSAVIWNPWVDKSRTLSQFDDDAWTNMLCIETARVWNDLLTIEPGDTAYMAVHLRAIAD